MRAERTLALLATPVFDEGAQEFLRILVGLLAGGHESVLREIGAGVGVLSGDPDLPEESEDHLLALADFDILPTPATPAELREAVEACTRLIRIGAPDRPGRPALLIVDAEYLAGVTDEALLADLLAAGQVLRG